MANTKIENVATVDGKVKRDIDLGEEMKAATEAANASQQKLAEEEARASKLLAKWADEEKNRELKLRTEVATRHRMGTMVPDPTVIPEYLYTRGGEQYKLRDDSAYVYRWVRAIGETPRVPWRRTQGYEPMYYDDIKHTENDWQRYGAEGYILLGDCILMRIPRRKHDVLKANKEYLDQLWSRKTEEDFLDTAGDLGVQVYREGPSGRREFA